MKYNKLKVRKSKHPVVQELKSKEKKLFKRMNLDVQYTFRYVFFYY